MKTHSVLLLAMITAAAHGGPRTSTDYSLTTEISDAGGERSASSIYTNDSSIGGVVGISTAASPAEIAKNGYIGQLYDMTAGLALSAASQTVNENANDQITAGNLLDDSTLLALPAASVTWSIASGPLTSINASGLATAGIVYQNTSATVQGIYAGNILSLGLTVLDSLPDNFGGYAGDGVGDGWQMQYFGPAPNPNAGPNVDFDGTGQTNLFKHIAGLNPLDPSSRFVLKIEPVPGQPNREKLIFSPRLNDRTYTVTSNPSLTGGSYLPLSNPSAPSDNGTERTITDLNATDATRFYRVEISKP